MANIKSSKKDIKRIIIRRERNKARMSELKTAIKKVVAAQESGDVASVVALARVAQSKIARAQGKGLLKQNSASRKISSLAKLVSEASR